MIFHLYGVEDSYICESGIVESGMVNGVRGWSLTAWHWIRAYQPELTAVIAAFLIQPASLLTNSLHPSTEPSLTIQKLLVCLSDVVALAYSTNVV